MLTFLEEVLSEKELIELEEILDYSLNRNVDLQILQEKISLANFLHSKLTKIIFKLRLTQTDFEIEYDQWYGQAIHNVKTDFGDDPKILLKTIKDYERELKRTPEYAEIKKSIDKVKSAIKTLESKEKELISLDWKVKYILDVHKIQHQMTLTN